MNSKVDTHVDALLANYDALSGSLEHISSYYLPSRLEVDSCLSMLRELIFPGYVGRPLIRGTKLELREHIHELVETVRSALKTQVYRGLHHKVQVR